MDESYSLLPLRLTSDYNNRTNQLGTSRNGLDHCCYCQLQSDDYTQTDSVIGSITSILIEIQ